MTVLEVFFHGGPRPQRLGRLAWRAQRYAFEYDGEYLNGGVNLSPFGLQWRPGLQVAEREPFGGLRGLFNDSLPDGWGLMLMDRAWRAAGRDPSVATPLDRLALVCERAMGALSYRPDEGPAPQLARGEPLPLDAIAAQAVSLYEGEVAEVPESLFIHGSSPGGARPKMLVGLSGDGRRTLAGAGELPPGYSHWLAKFPAGRSPRERALVRVEHAYHLMAMAAGITMMPCRLQETPQGLPCFLTRRFDRRDGGQRVHVHSVAGLLHADFRVPNLDYGELMKLTAHLTRRHEDKVQLFRRMAFNVLTGNRDDHSKNFAFMLTPAGEWRSTPAYDLTFSAGMAGEHTTTVNGRGKDIGLDDLLAVAKIGSISAKQARRLVAEVGAGVSRWSEVSREWDIPAGLRQEIARYIAGRLRAC